MANYAQELQPELAVNQCKIVTVSVDNYLNTLEHRHAVGGYWPFLCDFERQVVNQLGIEDVTDKRFAPVAIPYTFVLDGKREIYKIYNGWWYLGRPRTEELRQDLRVLMSRRPEWLYQPNEQAEGIQDAPKNLQPGQRFPDFELPNHAGELTRLSHLVDGWPTALIFVRGQHDPADRRQLENYVRELQPNLRSGYFKLVTVSVDDQKHARWLRQSLGAEWPFLSDADRSLITNLGIVDTTDESYSPLALPFTFLLDADLEIYKAYFGWHFLGRATVEELRHDFRTLMSRRSDWEYADKWDYHAIHSDERFDLTHGMMDHFHPKQD